MDDLDATDPSSDFLSLADRSPEWLETITILLSCIIFWAGNSGGAWSVILFFHAMLIRCRWVVYCWQKGQDSFIHVSGAFAGMSGRLGSTSPECLPMTSPAWWPQPGGLRFPLQEQEFQRKRQKPQGFLWLRFGSQSVPCPSSSVGQNTHKTCPDSRGEAAEYPSRQEGRWRIYGCLLKLPVFILF